MGTGSIRLIKRLLICIILTGVNSCTNEKINGDNTSNSITDSKKNKVFITEFIPSKGYKYFLNNYKIKECWLEQCWNYQNSFLKIRKLSNYRLVLKIIPKTDDVDIDIISIHDNLKINSSFGYDGDLRTIDLKSNKIGDSLTLEFISEEKVHEKVLLINKSSHF